MYLAEIHGKLSSKLEGQEDLLTSNVFSFFKYTDRNRFLRGYLQELNINISPEEADQASFFFWPNYIDGTQPDLVIVVGKYYLLIEAKYFSDFDPGNADRKHQLIREIEGGSLEAKRLNKIFILIVLTTDSYLKKEKYKVIPKEFNDCLKPTNWQKVTEFLDKTINVVSNKREKDFAVDLYNLLNRKKLRGFKGYTHLGTLMIKDKYYPLVFFESKTATFRGDFFGFIQSLSFEKKLHPHTIVFLNQEKELFTLPAKPINAYEQTLFYNREKYYGR